MIVTNLLISNPGLGLQSLQEAAERLGLAGQRSQETDQTVLLTHLSQDPDDHFVYGSVAGCGRES